MTFQDTLRTVVGVVVFVVVCSA